MLNNNNNNHHASSAHSCSFAEQIAACIYREDGEENAVERIRFEKHLSDCSDCSGEIAAFGVVRSSIGDWREEVFALDVPALEIPILKQPKNTIYPAVSTVKRSRLADFRSLFSLSPAWKTAGAAFAALIVCVGLALFVFVFSGKREIADVSNQQIENSSVPPVKIEPIKNKSTEITGADNPKQINRTSKALPNVEIADSKPNNSTPNKKAVQNSSIIKVSNSVPKQKMSAPKPDSLTARNETNANAAPKPDDVQKIKAPKLADFKEEEDKSLRLAELFDEIGG